MSEFEPSITPRIYAPSLGRDTAGREHRSLRDAIDAAQVEGTVTWITNTAGAPVAAIVPRGIAELGQTAWDREVAKIARHATRQASQEES
jgi:hypothetical protein